MSSHRKFKTFFVPSIIISLAIFIIFGEIGVRLFVKNSEISPDVLRELSLQYEPALFARHIMKAKAHSVSHKFGGKKGLEWEINEKGYRGPNFQNEKPEGTIRIMVYGGSAAFDSRTSKFGDWPRLTEYALHKAGYTNIEIINAGQSGHTAVESVGKLFTEGFRFTPDYVLLYNAWNDMKYFDSPESFLRTIKPKLHKFDYRIHNKNWLDRVLCNSSHLYTVLRRIYFKKTVKLGKEGIIKSKDTRSSIAVFKTLQFRQYQLAMEMFVDLARNIGASPILVTQARLVHADNTEEQRQRIDYHHVGLNHEALLETFARQDAIIKRVALAKQISVFDASQEFSGKDWAFDDHVHFVPKGAEAMGKFISSKIIELLKQQP